ncbi:MAG: PDZ domain-containing protein [Pelolinea sp.]|nr:PDZ domain-containing protein [Pelolinea sp.]
MNKKTLNILASVLVISALAACNGAVKIDLPTLTPKAATQNTPAETAPTTKPAAESTAPDDLANLQTAYEGIYAKVLPSVVSIAVSETVTQTLPNNPNLPNDFNFGNGQQQQAPEFQQTGAGSGFIWDTEGHIVTNNHVVDGADLIRVNFSDGTSNTAIVIGKDSQSDLAVLKVDVPAAQLKPIEVADSTQAKIGQIVVAIGNPFRLSGSMTTGIISGLGRSLVLDSIDASGLSYSIPDVIQTDAAINPGNSGGVLVDIEGKLIGVTTAIESPVRANSGIGYVVPSVIVQKVVPILIKDGSYQQPWIGISGNDLTPEVATVMNLETTQRGALVAEVTAGSPADKAGLVGSAKTAQVDGQDVKVGGDVITSADGKPVNDFEDLVAFLARYATVDQTIKLTVLRDGKSIEIPLTLAARPAPASVEKEILPEETSGGAWLGIQSTDMSPAIAEAMGLKKDVTGALVVQVSADGPADKAGIKGSYKPFEDNGQQTMIGGDIITTVDGKAISGTQRLAETLAGFKPGDVVKVTLLRDGKSSDVQVTLGEKPAN